MVIADGHAPPAPSTDRQSLEQRRPFTGRTTVTFTRVGGSVGGQGLLIEFELFPGDVAGVGVADQRGPVLTRHLLGAQLARRVLADAESPIGEGTRVARVVQRPQDPPVAQWHPGQFALVHSGAHPRRERQALIAKGLHGGPGRAGAGKGGEEMTHSLLHPGIGVEDDLAGRVIDQSDREQQGQLTATGLGDLTAAQAGPDEVQLGL